MDLQQTFYFIGIIFMILWILIFIGVAFGLWKAYSTAQSIKKHMVTRAVGLLAARRVEFIATALITIATFFIKRAGNAFRKK
ncbi:hypothetical protein HGB07_01100 [Candidatus Roizmanbacteria bacterium]|nr:hypothetical protein [Candidatus Roizmanbacteria bacterium]